MPSPTHPNRRSLSLMGWGAASILMYLLLFVYEQEILHWSSQGRWFFIFPVLIAFAFSLVHGHFTGAFWHSLGVRAKQ